MFLMGKHAVRGYVCNVSFFASIQEDCLCVDASFLLIKQYYVKNKH